MARMNHALRNRQQRARESLDREFEDERRRAHLDKAAWEARLSTGALRMIALRFAIIACARDAGLRKQALTMRFPGTLDELRHMLRPLKLAGAWTSGPSRVWTLRCWDGAVLNWAERSGALWIQGPEEASRQLERRLRKRLKAWLYRQFEKQGRTDKG